MRERKPPRDPDVCTWGLMAVKRWWVPDWLYAWFAWDSKVWGLRNAATMHPWRWILHRSPTEFEVHKARRPVEHG